jgi:hypothetical protein
MPVKVAARLAKMFVAVGESVTAVKAERVT